MRVLLVAVLGAAVLGACNDPPGATLEAVPKDSAVTSIELFVGESCDSCPDSMSAPGLLPRRTNIAIVQDTAVFIGDMRGGNGLFRLQSKDDRDEYVPLMIAVGYNDSHDPIEVGIVRDSFIPAGRAEYWKTYLEPATPIMDPESDGEHIAMWPAGRTDRNGHPRCVMVQHGQYNTDAVVPADDTDCDAVPPTSECAPFTPGATNVAPNVEQTDCVRLISPVGGTSANGALCMLGGTPCSELTAAPPLGGCSLLDIDYCAPDVFCSGTCFGFWDCVAPTLQQLDKDDTLTSHATCTVPMTSAGDDCSPQQRTDAELDLSELLAGSSGGKCRGVQIHELMPPLKFGDHAAVGNGTVSARLIDDNCKVAINWDGPYGHGVTDGTTVPVLADIEFDNHKHMLLPIILALGACATPMACDLHLAQNDSLLLCNREVKDTMSCASPDCPNFTVACGERCCGPGEACVDGTCMCGGGTHCVEANCGGGSPQTAGACGVACCDPISGICPK